MPRPHTGEEHKDWISRCMGSSESQNTFPDEGQRYAFCESRWESRHKDGVIMDHVIRDSVVVDATGLTRTRDGYLVGEARIARAGNVQQYLGSELGLTGDDASRMFGVYRDPDVVFDKDSMASLAGRPVTRNHPEGNVDASSWRDLAVGSVGGRIVRDGEHVVASMAIMDAAAVAEVEGGARALSAGYTVGIVRDAGVSPSGEKYEFRQAGQLRFNHVAYLPDNNPRAGNTRIGDAHHWGAAPITNADTKGKAMPDNLRTVLVDGLSVQTTDAGAQAIEKLTKTIAERDKSLADMETATAAHLAAKDKELGAKDAEIEKLKKDQLDDAAIDARVQARADLVSRARVLDKDIKIDGLSDADIRRTVVQAKLGDAAVKDRADAYVEARFDALVEDATTEDPMATAYKNGGGGSKPITDAASDARKAMLADMQSAHSPKEA